MTMNPNLYSQANFGNWSFRTQHMGLDAGGKNTNAITPENIFYAYGPARLSQIGGDFASKVFPIGLVESISIAQQKMVQQVMEIGSRRTYHLGGRSTGNVNLARTLMSLSSLMAVAQYGMDDFDPTDNPAQADVIGEGLFNNQDQVAPLTAQKRFAINMQSAAFDRPHGMFFYMLDQRNKPYACFYLEECMFNSHAIGFSTGQITINEQASALFDRALPVAVGAA